MTVQVVLPGVLADMVGGARHLDVQPAGGTLGDLLDELAAQHPVLGRRIRDETGRVRRFVNVYVDGEDVRFCGGTAAPVPDGTARTRYCTGRVLRPSVAHQLAVTAKPSTDEVGTIASKLRR